MPFSLLPSIRPGRFLLSKRLLFSALIAVVVFAAGCKARPPHDSPPVSVRSAAFVPASVMQVQTSALYQHARQECRTHEYRLAADHLLTLARTPSLTPDAVTFVQQQRDLCLRDAGLLPSHFVVAPALPAHAPADADCGPRALLIVCQKLGVPTTLAQLRQSAGTTAEGTTLAGLQQAAQKLGLKAEGVQVRRDALPNISTPAIAWDRRQHFIVLQNLEGNGDSAAAHIRDPNRSIEETISQESLLQRSGGVLLLLHR